MKKKNIVSSILLSALLLTACSSGVTEEDFKSLEDRVSHLEEANATSLETKKATDTDSETNYSVTDTIVSKDGVQVTFNRGGVVKDVKGALEIEPTEGNSYVYAIVDLEFIGSKSSLGLGFYDISLTDGEITIGREGFIYTPSAIEALGFVDVHDMPTEFSPKETTTTVVFFKVPDKALNEADKWYLTFEDAGGLTPIEF